MTWQKKAPTKVGYWIRLNVVHRPEIVHVFEDYRNPDKALCVMWGWGGEKGMCRIEDILHKIEHFWWSSEPLEEFPEREPINR